MKTPEQTVPSFEENLKKALTELLVLKLLSEKEYYVGELADTLYEKSGGALKIVFPYAALYRMLEKEYIAEVKKRVAPDGRRRQYYGITDAGRDYLASLLNTYARFFEGVEKILASD